MDVNLMIACAMFVGLILGTLAGYGGGYFTGQAVSQQRIAEAHAVGYREGQRADFEAQAAQHVAEQSFAMQEAQMVQDAIDLRLERTYRSMERQQKQEARG
jgi:H+/gluconate symporter-like permease